MHPRRYAPILLSLPLLACSPTQRDSALIGVGAGACAIGIGAEAADQDWGAVVSAVGCWLADWGAARADRRAEAERRAKSAELRASEPAPAELDDLDQAAIALTQAQALMVADPCEESFAELLDAYSRCLALEPGFGRGHD